VFDRDEAPQGESGVTRLGGLQLGGFVSNVNARPRKWREFTLIE